MSKGKNIPLDNYSLETSFEPQGKSKGYLLFSVYDKDNKLKLQFGKKGLEVVEMEINLSKNKKGGE